MTVSLEHPIAVPERKWAVTGLTFSENEPWPLSILVRRTSSRFSGMFRRWEISSADWPSSRLAVSTVAAGATAADVATVLVAVAITATSLGAQI